MYSPQEAAAINAAEMVMRETMARYDPSHDAWHVQRVRKTAVTLAHHLSSTASGQRAPDLVVVELAALLHDVLDKKYVTPDEAADPYAYFLPFFQTIAKEYNLDLISDGRARLVTRIVENVSWTTEKKLIAAGLIEDWHRTCLELHCVQDADRLDAIGAFGIMRCAAFSSVTNRQVTNYYIMFLLIKTKFAVHYTCLQMIRNMQHVPSSTSMTSWST
ncbi:hypothetical protein HWV62_42036 [Athelia sp. TMB]|nr:hypothetical protein HWV62_42036 [Athelia sp. TMB]